MKQLYNIIEKTEIGTKHSITKQEFPKALFETIDNIQTTFAAWGKYFNMSKAGAVFSTVLLYRLDAGNMGTLSSFA